MMQTTVSKHISFPLMRSLMRTSRWSENLLFRYGTVSQYVRTLRLRHSPAFSARPFYHQCAGMLRFSMHSVASFHTTSKCYNKSPPSQPPPEKESNEEEKDNREPNNMSPSQIAALAALNLIVAFLLLEPFRSRNEMPIEWEDFVSNYLSKGEVESIHVERGSQLAMAQLHPGAAVQGNALQPRPSGALTNRRHVIIKADADTIEERLRTVEKELGISPTDSLKIVWHDNSNVYTVVRLFVFGMIILTVLSVFRSMRFAIKSSNPFDFMSKVSYTRGDLASSTAPKTLFKDIAGMKEAKVEIKEYVEYLKNPSKFQSLGARIPRGALLLGPPGCGKTLLAKAVAAESDVPFLVMAGSEFVEMIGGLGASRVRSLFKDARNLRPCIIYIDEIDALGRSRAGSGESFEGGGSESEHTLNQLLVEMDGMADNSGIIMLASTNRANVLDSALLRPGRFDRHVTIELPTLLERIELFEMYLKKINLSKPIGEFVKFLAQATPGMTGADIANLCNEAALNAARDGEDTVKESNLTYALDKILAGQARVSNAISQEEKKTIAFHECGHVLVSWLLERTDALLKVSVIPRTSAALGFAQYMPSDKKLYSREDLFERMCVMLGGRAAETVVFNRVTTGAQDDLDKVSRLAYSQIKQYGMGDSAGLLSFPSDEQDDYQNKPYSKDMQQRMDMEAQQLIAKAYKTAESLIINNRPKLDKLCELLLKHEEMSYDDVKKAIGPPPYGEKNLVDMG
ncbi:mitochondrial inner membrane m-AAA protease component paraplegin-like [Watersipora subatra]|uniref:mitochondrial inner membrane m-AAA protease component paraplegin-like n=1 Tax=Watersipora subatra TaxID=2589382 RepID=UPI00355BB76C